MITFNVTLYRYIIITKLYVSFYLNTTTNGFSWIVGNIVKLQIKEKHLFLRAVKFEVCIVFKLTWINAYNVFSFALKKWNHFQKILSCQDLWRSEFVILIVTKKFLYFSLAFHKICLCYICIKFSQVKFSFLVKACV